MVCEDLTISKTWTIQRREILPDAKDRITSCPLLNGDAEFESMASFAK